MSIDEDTLVAPKIVKKLPKMVETTAGEAATLEVKAIGKPKPTTKWLKADEEIIPSEDYLIENYPDGTSVLTVTNVQPDDIDQITFEAVNAVGAAKTTTKLHVEGISLNVIQMMGLFSLSRRNFDMLVFNHVFFSAVSKLIRKQTYLSFSLTFSSLEKKETYTIFLNIYTLQLRHN